MKHLILILFATLFSNGSHAQKPEKIYGNARHHMPLSYYKEQAIVWKKEVDKNPKDPNAWYNYYNVNRNLRFNDTTDKRSQKEKRAQMMTIVDDMEKNIPGSYEFNICKYQMNAFDDNFLPYLRKAAELGPDRSEHIDYLINHGETSRDSKERDLYSIRKFELGQFSTGIIYYNYNVLVGLDKNAILVTAGDNDTYPIWYLQALGIRKDVTVVNVNLQGLHEYSDKLMAEIGVGKYKLNSAPNNDVEDTRPEHLRFVAHLATNKNNRPVYVSLTTACYKRFTQEIEGDLYLTGLAYLYSKKSIDNIAILKNNYENHFALDYIDKPFYLDISPDMVKMINFNYAVPFFTLYDHYKLSGEKQKAEAIREKIMVISKGTENEAEVTKCLAEKQ